MTKGRRTSFTVIHIGHWCFHVREFYALMAYSTRLSVAENTQRRIVG